MDKVEAHICNWITARRRRGAVRRRRRASSIYERLVVQRGRGGGIIGVSHKRGRPPIIAKGTRYAWRGLPGLRRRRRLLRVEGPLLHVVHALAPGALRRRDLGRSEGLVGGLVARD